MHVAFNVPLDTQQVTLEQCDIRFDLFLVFQLFFSFSFVLVLQYFLRFSFSFASYLSVRKSYTAFTPNIKPAEFERVDDLPHGFNVVWP